MAIMEKPDDLTTSVGNFFVEYQKFYIFILAIISVVAIIIIPKLSPNKFADQLQSEEKEKFTVLYAPEVLADNYNVQDVEYISHIESEQEYFYITADYENDKGDGITFVQSKDPYYDEKILRHTELTDIAYKVNTYYFYTVDKGKLLFWYNDDTAYFLISNFDENESVEISREILQNKLD